MIGWQPKVRVQLSLISVIPTPPLSLLTLLYSEKLVLCYVPAQHYNFKLDFMIMGSSGAFLC